MQQNTTIQIFIMFWFFATTKVLHCLGHFRRENKAIDCVVVVWRV